MSSRLRSKPPAGPCRGVRRWPERHATTIRFCATSPRLPPPWWTALNRVPRSQSSRGTATTCSCEPGRARMSVWAGCAGASARADVLAVAESFQDAPGAVSMLLDDRDRRLEVARQARLSPFECGRGAHQLEHAVVCRDLPGDVGTIELVSTGLAAEGLH